MFNNKIINIITRTLGAIFLLIGAYLIIMLAMDVVILFDLKKFLVIIFSFLFAIVITGIICVCIGEFLEWVFDKIDK